MMDNLERRPRKVASLLSRSPHHLLMHEVTPSVVAIAVSILMVSCTISFQVSFLIFIINSQL